MNVKTLLRVPLVTMTAVLLLAVACGGQEKSAPTTPTEALSGTPPSSPVSGDASATLLDLLAGGLDIIYKVTYQTTAPDGNTYVVFNRPPDTRIDTVAPGSSEPSSSIIAAQGPGMVSCSGGPDHWECSEVPPPEDPLVVAASPVIFPKAADLESFEVSETGARQIAGEAARCFRLHARQEEAGREVEYCLNSDGVPLFSAGPFGSALATEFSVDVSDDDFTPPAEPRR